ncbi:MAG TPA: biotin carboxylase N-terminal domain-containing protein [Candidatus Binataceae bacterium]|jgi:acetyl/propionyl-CoA carboxylase alpha subunit|nr:biotin carboxylase N-terminal domain-containing protein [Candidatus Binataceae bacterium]
MTQRKIKKLLVANRGEIALRIIRTARALGLQTVAVYSEADAAMPHVAAADEARLIGPPEALHSYLNIPAIIEAAQAAGADAIHPGYGFLSESAQFAGAVTRAGLTFVGPPPEVLSAAGDKIGARQLAQLVGVPVVPGTETADAAVARSFAAITGYPILIKAAAGGGGRGMRVVPEEAALGPALEAAAREAQAAFKDGRLFIEKYLAAPRHVEVQILGAGGRVIALGERDCSVQRRHQKIIEESPAPGLSPTLRARLMDAAAALASAVGYQNAGTVEFLVDGEVFYFLEINARLQVEHPVTELRFNCDLVAIQLSLAAGEPLIEPPPPRGHAIECRIYAEDARNDFRPAAGPVLYLQLPAGPGTRVDTFLTRGIEIGSHYDGLLAKVITYGHDREEARRRAVVALDEFMLAGVLNTASFLRDVVASERFARGELSTAFVPEFLPTWRPAEEPMKAAAILAALAAQSGPASGTRAARTAGADRRGRSPWEALGALEFGSRR